MRYIDQPESSLCRECNGRCCKGMPGAMSPIDVHPLTKGRIVEMLLSGQYAIDYWEGDPREGEDEMSVAYFIRPAVAGCDKLVDASWGGPCGLFVDGTGCSLSYEDRPQACRSLQADEDGHCRCEHNIKQQIAIDWLPYNDMIDACIKTVREIKERNEQ